MPSDTEIQAAENSFFAQNQEALAYKTDANLDTLYSYIVGAWGEVGTGNSACWEIAYKSLKGKLKRIPGYVPPLTDEERAWVSNTPSYQARDLYKNDKKFRAVFDAIAEEEAELKKNPWLRLDADTYRNMDPNHAAQLYVDNPLFAAAVQRLIDGGQI